MENEEITNPGALDDEQEQGNENIQTPEKTFTQSEVDALIKKRIDKQNAKHGIEVDSFNVKIADLEKQLADSKAECARFNAQMEMASWKANASKETGVPAELLRGSNAEEIMEHAKAILETMNAQKKAYPSFRDGGGADKPRPSNANIFGDFLKENFSN